MFLHEFRSGNPQLALRRRLMVFAAVWFGTGGLSSQLSGGDARRGQTSAVFWNLIVTAGFCSCLFATDLNSAYNCSIGGNLCPVNRNSKAEISNDADVELPDD
jgi:hypothetical protein